METVLVILIFAAAVWYLYRGIRKKLKADGPACGCAGCEGRSAGSLLADRTSCCGDELQKKEKLK